MGQDSDLFPEDERLAWRERFAESNRNNVLCHCRSCDREWVVSAPEACVCGSRAIEWIVCWQFPDG